jgi:hypothetical protein
MNKYFSDNFPIQICLKQGNTLSSLLFIFALKYAVRKFHESQVGLLVYAEDVNLLGGHIHTTNKNTETLINASKEFVL